MLNDLISGKRLSTRLNPRQQQKFISSARNFRSNTDNLISEVHVVKPKVKTDSRGRKGKSMLNTLYAVVQEYDFFSDLPDKLIELIENCSLSCTSSGRSLSNTKIFYTLKFCKEITSESVALHLNAKERSARQYAQACRLVITLYENNKDLFRKQYKEYSTGIERMQMYDEFLEEEF